MEGLDWRQVAPLFAPPFPQLLYQDGAGKVSPQFPSGSEVSQSPSPARQSPPSCLGAGGLGQARPGPNMPG